jgi:sugar lactone lactonase YvrE
MREQGMSTAYGARNAGLAAVAGMLLLVGGCGDSSSPIQGCAGTEVMVPDCRFFNPEDLAVTPRGERLLVSQMGRMDGSLGGDILLYSPADGSIERLFPGADVEDDRSWGDPACPPPDLALFSPHGLDLVARADGSHMLLVVNHGGRESVELFHVTDDDTRLTLRWRGCAEGPEQAAFNDVEGRRNGGFYVTHMMPRDSQFSAMLAGALWGGESGFVYHWDPAAGFDQVAGSAGPFPNGIALTRDERILFINMYLSGEVHKLDLSTGEVVGVAHIPSPDNSSWADDGRLLVASHLGGLLASLSCQNLESGSCGFEFQIVALDPETLSEEVLIRHQGAPMGGVTVAVELDGNLYLGTYAGDRIARVTGFGISTRDEPSDS